MFLINAGGICQLHAVKADLFNIERTTQKTLNNPTNHLLQVFHAELLCLIWNTSDANVEFIRVLWHEGCQLNVDNMVFLNEFTEFPHLLLNLYSLSSVFLVYISRVTGKHKNLLRVHSHTLSLLDHLIERLFVCRKCQGELIGEIYSLLIITKVCQGIFNTLYKIYLSLTLPQDK